MPKSKRAKIIHTSSVTKKPSKQKSASLFSAVHAAADQYPYVFVFDVENMRNTYLKDVRHNFATDGRIFFGKTKVMAKALGTGSEDEHLPGLAKLNEHLKGSVGVLFSSRDPQAVLDYFKDFVEVDFARAGVEASRSFTVPAGIVYSRAGEVPLEDDVPMPHSLEVMVRKWGMPTRLDKGKVMLDQEYELCKEGQVLNSNQTALLKQFGVATAEFRVRVVAYYSAGSQEVIVVEQDRNLDADGVEEGSHHRSVGVRGFGSIFVTASIPLVSF